MYAVFSIQCLEISIKNIRGLSKALADFVTLQKRRNKNVGFTFFKDDFLHRQKISTCSLALKDPLQFFSLNCKYTCFKLHVLQIVRVANCACFRLNVLQIAHVANCMCCKLHMLNIACVANCHV